MITGSDGVAHIVLSDGWRRVRLDVSGGGLAGDRPLLLHYRLLGVETAGMRLLTLRRFLHLYQHRRFAASLYPGDRRMPRRLLVLRVHDALQAGASQREIAEVLFGQERTRLEWGGGSDSLRARVRRLAVEARGMAAGGYRSLLRRLQGGGNEHR